MAWRVEWTEVALNDVHGIHVYIAFDSANYAGAMVRRIRDAAASLRQFPRRGATVSEFERDDIRHILVGNYRIIYHVSDERVVILAVIHGARDLKSLWERENRQLP